MKALLEHLLVQARAVEPGGHRQFDVLPECRVAGRRPDAVGVKALIEHQPQVDRLVVEVDLVALDVHLAQSSIGSYPVQDRAAVQHLQNEIVEERVTGRPGPGRGDGQDARHAVRCRDLGLADQCLAVHERGAKAQATLLSVEAGGQDKATAIEVGHDLALLQAVRIHRFHPYRLPDTRGACIVATARGIIGALLAARLHVGACLVADIDHQVVALAGRDKARDIVAKRGRAAPVSAHRLAVDVHLALIVYRSKVQDDAFAGPPGWDVQAAVVPHHLDKVGVLDA